MVKIESKTERKVNDYKLSRYVCYLIAQNEIVEKWMSNNSFKSYQEKIKKI